jgi:transcriptional regulator with GAF, ATPase, and Fis domain
VWHVSDLAALGADADALEALRRAKAVRVVGGWIAIDGAWESQARKAADAAPASALETVAAALKVRWPCEPWAFARAAELLARAGSLEAADAAHARALSYAEDALTRRELVTRWMAAVNEVRAEHQLPLRARAADRALVLGEAEEAYRWAQSAAALAPEDTSITLLFGRAAVALGDLVAAKVALERGQRATHDAETCGLIAAELAEIACLSGTFEEAAREAQRALDIAESPPTRLKARNTLGKILLAEARWEEADRHFAEDAWTASSCGEQTAALRARLNRGIAVLSKGLAEEARSIFEGVLLEGERVGETRACAFALDNLTVVAMLRHDYGGALALGEHTLKLRKRLGDRLATGRVLTNLAVLRRKLGLLDHAEHAIAFGRRMLGPGMPAAPTAHYSLAAARIALSRGNTVEARRDVARAIIDFESAGLRTFVGEAHRVAARIALEDGDLVRATEALDAAHALATTDEGRAEVGLLAALLGRASGDCDEKAALEALGLARVSGEEELLIETHTLLAEIHRANGRMEAARAQVEQAMMVRDQVAGTLTHDVRAAFLSRANVVALGRMQVLLSEPAQAVEDEAAPRTQRSSRTAAALPREIIGDDPAIRGLLAAVKKVARSNSTVLIRGESGTGKELVAEAVHRASGVSGPLVTVNCAALVETLLLSELFGHEKGAFTGAIARRRGRFELAEGGTLFLDEIGDISPRTQVALLRVLQERTFERVGGTTPIRANVRIVCATHRDLKAMVERGEFREDLYYRLRGITLEVPALRARLGDLPRISDCLLARIAAERGEAKKALAADALDLLSRHRWPGNVRELENALRAASLFAESEIITASHLVENVDDLRAVAQSAAASRMRGSFPPPPMSRIDLASSANGVDIGPESDDEPRDDADAPLPAGEANATSVAYAQVRGGGVSLSDMKRQIERDCIARALAETKGNITRAAALLGMKRPRLSQLVKQYGLAAVSSEAS